MMKKFIITLAIIIPFFVLHIHATAQVTGPCVNCHTMHNSQDGTAMATYGAVGQPWKGTGS